MITFHKKSFLTLCAILALSANFITATSPKKLKNIQQDQEKGFAVVQDPSNPMMFHIEVTPDTPTPAVDLDPNYTYNEDEGSFSDTAEEIVTEALDATANIVGTAATVTGAALNAGADAVENITEAISDAGSFVGTQAVAFEAAIENVAGNIATEISDLANAGMPAFQDAVTNAAHAIEKEAQEIANNKYVVRIKNAICSAFEKTKAFAENNHGKITTALAAAVVYLLYHHTNGK